MADAKATPVPGRENSALLPSISEPTFSPMLAHQISLSETNGGSRLIPCSRCLSANHSRNRFIKSECIISHDVVLSRVRTVLVRPWPIGTSIRHAWRLSVGYTVPMNISNISNERLDEFRRLYLEEFGEKISMDEASTRTLQLIE